MNPKTTTHPKLPVHPDTKGTKDIKTGFQSSPGSVPEEDQARIIKAQPASNDVDPKVKNVKPTSPR